MEKCGGCKVIAIANQKGGVAKTTTAANLAVGLVRRGKKVLAVDNDPQGDLSISLGIDNPDSLDFTIDDALRKIINDEEISPKDGIVETEEGVDLLPANLRYSGMELMMFSVINREQIMKEYLTIMRPFYDYIIVDCHATLGILNVNAFAAAHSVIIPVTPEKLPVNGLQQLIQILGMIKKKLNPNLVIEGVVFTNVHVRTNNAKEIMAVVKEAFATKIHFFEKPIPAEVKARECPATGRSIYEYDPTGRVARSYEALVEEVISNE